MFWCKTKLFEKYSHVHSLVKPIESIFAKTKVLSPCHMMHLILASPVTNNWSINSWMCIKRTPVHQSFTSTATWPLTTCLRFTLRPKCWLSRGWRTRSTAEVGRHLQCVSASSTEDKKKIWRDWRRFWQAQVRQTPQDNRSGGPFAQKPALNKRQLKNRVAFAKAHSLPKGWTLEKWQKVDFSDESSVELHHSCRKYCRRPTGARMDPRFTQKTVKIVRAAENQVISGNCLIGRLH